MKIIVDELPYYVEFCPFWATCPDNASDEKCPRYWNKNKVCADENHHQCHYLLEVDQCPKP